MNEPHPDFKSPKKLRASGGRAALEPEASHRGGEEVLDNREADLPSPSLGGGAPFEAVAETAQAFRQLRMRVSMGGVEHGGGGGGSGRVTLRGISPGAQPRSPKKRKATVTIDKEFILKDDKVKRNTDQQGDISQARGMLGALLFEFGQLELNKDLLEAIKRTESRTGRQNRGARGSASRAQQELDRLAFEYTLSEAGELLHSQLATLAAHSEDPALQRAMLRAYAVQAIATFADDDYSSEDEEGGGGEAAAERSPSPQHQPSGGLHEGVLGSEDEGEPEGNEREGEEGDGSLGGRSPRWRSPSVDMMRAGSATPTPAVWQAGEQQAQHAQQQAQQAQGSASEQVSSSILPDASPEAALEDTATMSGAAEAQEEEGADSQPLLQAGGAGGLRQQRALGGAGPAGLPAAPLAAQQQQGRQQQLEGEARGREDGGSGEGQGLPGSPAPAATTQSSGLDDVMQQLSDAVDDMLRSPDAVSSRPRLPTWGVLPPSSSQPSSQPSSQDSGSQPPNPPAPGSLAEVQQLFGRGQGVLLPQLHGNTGPDVQQQGGGAAGGQVPLQQQQQELCDGPTAAHPGQPPNQFHHAHQHQRLHFNHHRQLRTLHREGHQRHPLPSLTEEGGSPMKKGGQGPAQAGAPGAGHGSSAARLPPRMLHAVQHAEQQPASSGGSGSDGTEQSGAGGVHSEALKRQRTDAAADDTTGALHILTQRAQRDSQQQQQQGWAQQSSPQPGAGLGSGGWLREGRGSPLLQASPAQESTSPLLEPQRSPAALQQVQQQSLGTGASPLPTLPTAAQQQQPPAGGTEAAAVGAAAAAAAVAVVQQPGDGQQQLLGVAGGGEPVVAEAEEGSVDAKGRAPGTGSSAWGSSLVCADLTVNDVASKYWPFLRSAMQGQGAALGEDDTALVAALVCSLGEAISSAYLQESGGRRPAPETKSLIAATVFDDMFRETLGQESSQGDSK